MIAYVTVGADDIAGAKRFYCAFLPALGYALPGPTGPMIDTHFGAGGFAFHGPWGTSVSSNLTPQPTGSGNTRMPRSRT